MKERIRLGGVRLAAVLSTATLLFAACGGGGDGDVKEPEPLSLDEQFGLDPATSAKRERDAEFEIQACMKAQGFEYVAVDPEARRAALLGSTGLKEGDFEAHFGYGITTLFEERRAQIAGEANQKVRAALDESQRAAYDRALVGDNLEATFADAVDSGDFSRLGGCTKDAADTVYGGREVLQSLLTGLEEVDARVLADPAMVKAVTAWSSCMRAKGYELGSPDDVDVVLKRKLAAIVGSEPLAATDVGGPIAYDRAALEALQREEVKMVATDLACEEEHIVAVEERVRKRLEQEFRDQNVDLVSKVPPT